MLQGILWYVYLWYKTFREYIIYSANKYIFIDLLSLESIVKKAASVGASKVFGVAGSGSNLAVPGDDSKVLKMLRLLLRAASAKFVAQVGCIDNRYIRERKLIL